MDCFRIGLFLRPHGVRGEVKLLSLTDDPGRFSQVSDAYIEYREDDYRPIRVLSARSLGDGFAIVRINGIDTMDQAETLRDKYLCVDREHAVKLPEDTYFIKDLIGCRVISTDGSELGIMDDVYETNANDVYVVKGEGTKRLSVPALRRLLSRVDIGNKLIVFDAAVLSEVGLFED